MNMKKWIALPVLALMGAAAFAAAALAPVSITLQSKCTRAAKYEVKGTQPSTGTVEAGGKVKLSLEPGSKVYVDGELCVEVSATDAGSTYIVCR